MAKDTIDMIKQAELEGEKCEQEAKLAAESKEAEAAEEAKVIMEQTIMATKEKNATLLAEAKRYAEESMKKTMMDTDAMEASLEEAMSTRLSTAVDMVLKEMEQ